MEQRSIVLIGMAGVGKSTAGKLLAQKLGFEFVDVDEVIVTKTGKTLPEIIATEGDTAFRETEKQVMQEIDLQKKVLAPGGSIVYHEDLMSSIKEKAILVYLQDSFENIKERLETKNGLQNIPGLNKKSLKEIFKERLPLYKKYADITIDVVGKTPVQITESIVDQTN